MTIDFSTLPTGWGLALYAIEPDDPVTLELYQPDGNVTTITHQSLDLAWEAAEQVFRAAAADVSLEDLFGEPEAPPANDAAPAVVGEPDPFA